MPIFCRVLVTSAVCLLLVTPAQATFLYDNTVNDTFSDLILSAAEWADDLHMVSAGNMGAFEFGFNANGATSATVRFYTNDSTNSILPGAGSSLLHTEVVSLPGGSAAGLKHVDLTTSVALPQDIWMSVQFNGSSASMPMYNPPVVGSSFDAVYLPASSFLATSSNLGVTANFQLSVIEAAETVIPEP
ncbi:MAG: hypothetical protein ACOC46_02890, partial [Pirellulales bacterium]